MTFLNDVCLLQMMTLTLMMFPMEMMSTSPNVLANIASFRVKRGSLSIVGVVFKRFYEEKGVDKRERNVYNENTKRQDLKRLCQRIVKLKK